MWAVAAGGDYSLVLGAGGEVYSFGCGGGGRLGHGNAVGRYNYTPRVVKALKGVKVRAVAAGRRHSLVLGSAGKVYSFGAGGYGTLGHSNEELKHTPTPSRHFEVSG
eukprot:6499965-Prymnesium_polylepis.2